RTFNASLLPLKSGKDVCNSWFFEPSIWVENAPFDLKDKLKARGYRWNDGTDGRPKAWFTEVPQAQKEDEQHFLKTEIYLREVALLTREITAWDRFSARA
ncbi:hypothetical protein ACH0C8_15255, partial [Acetobacter lovaniensis]